MLAVHLLNSCYCYGYFGLSRQIDTLGNGVLYKRSFFLWEIWVLLLTVQTTLQHFRQTSTAWRK
ncbi:hypothetical protein [Nostoc sp.]|uniref:hypothetical protein n=1 Tax=Nostoc sp. TaxID=1180 RepID=UPI002FF648D6